MNIPQKNSCLRKRAIKFKYWKQLSKLKPLAVGITSWPMFFVRIRKNCRFLYYFSERKKSLWHASTFIKLVTFLLKKMLKIQRKYIHVHYQWRTFIIQKRYKRWIFHYDKRLASLFLKVTWCSFHLKKDNVPLNIKTICNLKLKLKGWILFRSRMLLTLSIKKKKKTLIFL